MDSNGRVNKLGKIINRDIEIGDNVYNFIGDIEYLIKEHYIVNKELRKRLYEIANNLDNELEKLIQEIKTNFGEYKKNNNLLIQGKLNEFSNIIRDFNGVKENYLLELSNFKDEINVKSNDKIIELTQSIRNEIENKKIEINTYVTEKLINLSNRVETEIQSLNTLKNNVDVIKLNAETKLERLNNLESRMELLYGNIREIIQGVITSQLEEYNINDFINNFKTG